MWCRRFSPYQAITGVFQFSYCSLSGKSIEDFLSGFAKQSGNSNKIRDEKEISISSNSKSPNSNFLKSPNTPYRSNCDNLSSDGSHQDVHQMDDMVRPNRSNMTHVVVQVRKKRRNDSSYMPNKVVSIAAHHCNTRRPPILFVLAGSSTTLAAALPNGKFASFVNTSSTHSSDDYFIDQISKDILQFLRSSAPNHTYVCFQATSGGIVSRVLHRWHSTSAAIGEIEFTCSLPYFVGHISRNHRRLSYPYTPLTVSELYRCFSLPRPSELLTPSKESETYKNESDSDTGKLNKTGLVSLENFEEHILDVLPSVESGLKSNFTKSPLGDSVSDALDAQAFLQIYLKHLHFGQTCEFLGTSSKARHGRMSKFSEVFVASMSSPWCIILAHIYKCTSAPSIPDKLSPGKAETSRSFTVPASHIGCDIFVPSTQEERSFYGNTREQVVSSVEIWLRNRSSEVSRRCLIFHTLHESMVLMMSSFKKLSCKVHHLSLAEIFPNLPIPHFFSLHSSYKTPPSDDSSSVSRLWKYWLSQFSKISQDSSNVLHRIIISELQYRYSQMTNKEIFQEAREKREGDSHKRMDHSETKHLPKVHQTIVIGSPKSKSQADHREEMLEKRNETDDWYAFQTDVSRLEREENSAARHRKCIFLHLEKTKRVGTQVQFVLWVASPVDISDGTTFTNLTLEQSQVDPQVLLTIKGVMPSLENVCVIVAVDMKLLINFLMSLSCVQEFLANGGILWSSIYAEHLLNARVDLPPDVLTFSPEKEGSRFGENDSIDNVNTATYNKTILPTLQHIQTTYSKQIHRAVLSRQLLTISSSMSSVFLTHEIGKQGIYVSISKLESARVLAKQLLEQYKNNLNLALPPHVRSLFKWEDTHHIWAFFHGGKLNKPITSLNSTSTLILPEDPTAAVELACVSQNERASEILDSEKYLIPYCLKYQLLTNIAVSSEELVQTIRSSLIEKYIPNKDENSRAKDSGFPLSQQLLSVFHLPYRIILAAVKTTGYDLREDHVLHAVFFDPLLGKEISPPFYAAKGKALSYLILACHMSTYAEHFLQTFIQTKLSSNLRNQKTERPLAPLYFVNATSLVTDSISLSGLQTPKSTSNSTPAPCRTRLSKKFCGQEYTKSLIAECKDLWTSLCQNCNGDVLSAIGKAVGTRNDPFLRRAPDQSQDDIILPGILPDKIKESVSMSSTEFSVDLLDAWSTEGIPEAFWLAEVFRLQRSLQLYFARERGILAHVNPDTSLIHANFAYDQTRTGRLVCSSPNMLGIPKGNIRTAFTSRFGSSGVILDIDYSMVELVTLALLCQDKNMLQDVSNNVDFHSRNVTVLRKDLSYEQVLLSCRRKNKEVLRLREKAKLFAFQRIYGASVQTLSKGSGLSIQEVRKLIWSENETYPSIKAYFRSFAKYVRRFRPLLQHSQGGYQSEFVYDGVGIIPSGNRFCFHEVGVNFPGFSSTHLRNYPVQGLAAEIIIYTTSQLLRRLLKRNYYERRAFLVNLVHDSIVMDVHEEVLEEVLSEAYGVLTNVKGGWGSFFPEFPWNKSLFRVEVKAGRDAAHMVTLQGPPFPSSQEIIKSISEAPEICEE